VNRFGTNLIVALAAFLMGLASASALSQIDSDSLMRLTSIVKTDAMGNTVANQD
jgi:hypothetical protein